MAIVRFSRKAEADLQNIGEYTLHTWGAEQADRYLSQIEDCCQRVGVSPLLGRSCNEIRPGLRQMPIGKHTVYYRQNADGILISRVLHQRMLPELHSMEDEI